MWDLLQTETGIRLACFLGAFAALATWEWLAPRRTLRVGKPLRWAGNLGLVAVNTLLLRLAAPLGAVGIAWFAESQGWGLFPNLGMAYGLAVIFSIVLLDLAVYLQHVMFHAVPLLWRLHMVHHADLDFDVTTGLRFHAAEILLSLGIKGAVVLLLGAPALAVVVFEVLLNATAMFNHSNVRIPRGLERLLRLLVVTPDMHRVHHSVHAQETHSNFGFNLPWWDWLLGTYRDQPADGHTAMTIGLPQFRDPRQTAHLHRALLMPLSSRANANPPPQPGAPLAQTAADPKPGIPAGPPKDRTPSRRAPRDAETPPAT